uniref:GumC family protein n=1 Tax=uncultured Sphingomonas sp. TaxID=158754 RepID=UPI0035CC6839
MVAAQLATLDAVPRGLERRQADALSGMDNMSARQIWMVIRRHLKLICGVVGLCTLAVLALELWLPDQYEATTTVQVELNDATGSNQADAARNQQRVENEARIYRSQALAEQVMLDLDLLHNRVFNNGRVLTAPQATTQLMAQTRVVTANDSDFIDIIVQTGSADLAARIANRYVETLQKMRAQRRQAWRNGLGRALALETARLGGEVEKAERTAADFRRVHRMPIGAGGAEDYLQMNRVAVEEASAAALNAATAERSASIDAASRLRTVQGATSPVLEQLQHQYDDLVRQRSQLSVTTGAQHPEMRALEAQVSQVGADLERERTAVRTNQAARNAADAGREQKLAGGEAAAAAARAGRLQGQLGAITQTTFRNNANIVDLALLDRRADVARQAYLVTAQRAKTVQSEPETTGVNSSMVSAASPPIKPVSPAPVKFTLAAFVGSSMLSLLAVFGIEMLDNRLRSGEQLNRLFGLRTLAMLPRMTKAIGTTLEDNPVVVEPQSLFSEVARNLASEIFEQRSAGVAQSILVTSPLPGDGKSSVALTIGAAAAAMGRRTIIVDLDLRRPGPSVLRSIQANSGAPDLLEMLKTGGEVRRLLPCDDTALNGGGEPHLPVVLSTREAIHNPAAALIQGRQVDRLLDELRESFDLIVINAPAILAVRDARVLSGIADSTLIVVRWGVTTVEQLRAAMQLVQNDVSGAVFNQVDYAAHARRGYGDAVQFYMGASSYYSDEPAGQRRFSLRSRFVNRRVNRRMAV